MAFFSKISKKIFQPFKKDSKPDTKPATKNEEYSVSPDRVEADQTLKSYLNAQMISVPSSNVSEIGYDKNTQTLYIRFKNGNVYAYYQVTLREAVDMYYASSHGEFVWDVLRERGTVFGHKKPYALVSSVSTGTMPAYLEKQQWSEEHGQIPESGRIPFTWTIGNGPYSPSWLAGAGPWQVSTED